jgi:hypothetical protein
MRGGVVPKRGGEVPKRGGVVPRREGVVLMREVVVPILTGMAALLLSFGLMMTGCDSDDPPPPSAGDYFSIDAWDAGSAGTRATLTVTVKKALEADKKATFTKVAGDPTDAPVEYIGGTGDKDAQATAIKNAINDKSGTLYDATVGTGATANIITLTATANGTKTKP